MSYIDDFQHTIVSSPPRGLRTDIRALMLVEPSAYCLNKFKKETGLEISNENMTGWLKLSSSVRDHEDSGGRCFVYCRSGSGILWIEGRPIHLTEGFYTIFNDTRTHSFDLLSRSCVLFVADIKGQPHDYIKESCFYVR